MIFIEQTVGLLCQGTGEALPYVILLTSIMVQGLATFLALRLIKVTGKISAWVFLAVAISLMAARRASTLYEWLSEGTTSFPLGTVSIEIIALTTSTLMAVGLWRIAPVFQTLQNMTREMVKQSEQRYALLANIIPAVIFKGYADGAADFFDDKITEVTGYSKEVFNSRQKNWLDIVAPADLLQAREAFLGALKGGKSYVREYRIQHQDGRLIWLQERSQIFYSPSGEIDYISGVFFDISDRREADEALSRSKEELSSWVAQLEQRNQELTLLSEMGDMLQSCLNPAETYKVAGKYLRQIFQGASGALMVLDAAANSLKVVSIWGELPVEEEEIFPREECWALRTGRALGVSEHHVGLCSHPRAPVGVDCLCIPMMAQGEALGIIRLQGGLQSPRLLESKKQLAVTVAEHFSLALANLNLRETLRQQSIRDPLTGLFNRRYLEEALSREVYRASRYHRPLGLSILDIDHFKQFNDTYGHDAGDFLLRELGAFLLSQVRHTDIACRYGGEEFVLIMPDMPLEMLFTRADDLREKFKNLTFRYQDRSLGMVTLSLGVATFPEHGDTAKALLQAADKALYRAKAEGRDRMALAWPSEEAAAAAELTHGLPG